MQIDGTIFHGWLLLCALSALLILDELMPVEGQPAASSHLLFSLWLDRSATVTIVD
jgi:hypothetical protein